MIWGVLSDIHSNLEALRAALEATARGGARGHVCCGDLVGYGPSPNEVVEAVAGLRPLHAVLGNHDLAVLGRMDLRWFNEHAAAAAVWTRWKLSRASARFLESLPGRAETPAFTVVHGSPRNPAEEYLLTPQQFVDNLRHFRRSPCFFGHTHAPASFARDDSPVGARLDPLRAGDVVRAPRGAWAVNPGSVGQPRDRRPEASCGLYDDESREFRLLRVPYDVRSTQRRMREVGLPEFLALRLESGQ